MNVFLLYLLLLKAALMSFSGLASLPIVHEDLVRRHRVLTDQQLSTAVAVGRSGPGPIGLYMVSAGYMAAGAPGALAGLLAMMTPAFSVIILLRYFSRHAVNPAVRRAIRAVLLASAGLLVSSTIPVAKAAVTNWQAAAVAVVSFAILAFTKVDTMWVILGAAVVGASSWLAV
jgi:chromate transporter